MNTLITLIAVLMLQQVQPTQEKETTIAVVVENINTNEGKILFSLYTKDTFMRSAPNYTASAEIVNGTAKVVFENIPEGTYAITCFHDRNGNGKMDFEPNGMPLEKYGVSTNTINPYGPPNWNDVKFENKGEPLVFNIKLTR